MPSTTIIFGVLLILLGIIGYVYGMMNGNASVTALIPSFFGLLIAILGFFALTSEKLRKHLMHVAMLVALVGFIVPAWRVLSRIGEISLSAAIVSQILMSVICLVLVILGVKSFIDARRSGAV